MQLQLSHTDSVGAIALSPDDKYLLTGSKNMYLWETKSGRLLRIFKGHDMPIRQISISPDGESALSSADGGTLRWDLETGRIEGEYAYDGAAFLPDGRSAIGRMKQGFALFDASYYGSERRRYPAPAPADYWRKQAYDVSIDGAYLAAALMDGTVMVWKVETGETYRSYPGSGDERIGALRFSRDGKRLAASAEWEKDKMRAAIVLDLESGRPEFYLPVPATGFYFPPDAQRMIAWGGPNTRWDLESGKPLGQFYFGQSADAVAVDASASYAFVGQGWYPYAYDLRKEDYARYFRGQTSFLYSVTVAPDGKRFYVADQDGFVRIYDSASGALLSRFRNGFGRTSRVLATPDGRDLLCASDQITAFELGTLEPRRQFSGSKKDWIGFVSLSGDGKLLLGSAVQGGYHTASLWSYPTGQLLRTFAPSRNRVTSALAPDGQRAYTHSSDDYAIKIWDTQTGALLASMIEHDLEDISLSSDGRYILTGHRSGELKLWDARSGKTLRSFAKQGGVITDCVFSPDGRYVASSEGSNYLPPRSIYISDTASGSLLFKLEGHLSGVQSIVFTPDGTRLISCSDDCTVRIWSTVDGGLLATILSSQDGSSVAMTPEGYFAATGANYRDLIHGVDGMKVVATEALYEAYLRPDIVKAKLAGEDIRPILKKK